MAFPTDLKHFTRSGGWGDPDKMDPALLYELDSFRAFVGVPMVVTSGYRTDPADASQHRLGKAVDVMFPTKEKPDLLNLFLAAVRFKFQGIGIYPFWTLKGREIGGLHLDVRAGRRALWMRDMRNNYLPLNRENIQRFLLP